MKELITAVGPFKANAPLLINALNNEDNNWLARKALSEALSVDSSEPQALLGTLEAIKPIAGIVEAIRKAEETLRGILPNVSATSTEQPNEHDAQQPNEGIVHPPPISAIDSIFPQLTGYKTFLGVALFVAVNIAWIAEVPFVTQQILNTVQWFAGGLAGAGLIAKIDRAMEIFKRK